MKLHIDDKREAYIRKVAACPFCGETHSMEVKRDYLVREFFVQCFCGAKGPGTDFEDAAIAAWNQRAEGKEADRAEA